MKLFLKQSFVFFTFVVVGCKSTVPQSDDYTKSIDSLLANTSPRPFNGVVYVQQDGKTKYRKAYGHADFAKQTPLAIDDRFSTMSVAKQFTAALVLQEVEKGTIELHVPVEQYLPDLDYSWSDKVTVHHLLNHTSGLDSERLEVPLQFEPGTKFSYSNIGYYVAGMVLEQQTGKRFEELVLALFQKCGMTNCFYPNPTTSTSLVKGHTVKEDGSVRLNESLSFEPKHYFGSHLIVTAPDLAKWNECLHHGKVLQPETFALMTDYVITAQHPLFGKQPVGYGYGLRINTSEPLLEIGHTGYHPREGYTAVNLYYPASKTSIVVLENVAYERFEIAYYFEQEIRTLLKKSMLLTTTSP